MPILGVKENQLRHIIAFCGERASIYLLKKEKTRNEMIRGPRVKAHEMLQAKHNDLTLSLALTMIWQS